MNLHYKAYCLDLDGTVYRGTERIQAATDFVNKLQKTGIQPYFITNNSSSSQQQIKDKLASFNIETETHFIMTSAIATAEYCAANYAISTVQIIGEQGLKEAFQNKGFKVVEHYADIVIVGIDRQVNYSKLSQACLAIRAGAKFIATNDDKSIPTEKGFEPGNGSFVKLIETSTGQQPLVIGKPESHMLRFIEQSKGYRKEEMVMVGDNYDTDILAGIRFGIDTIHVEGGVTSKEELSLKEVQPTYSIETLAELNKIKDFHEST